MDQVETTIFSLKPDAPRENVEDERRSGKRHMTLFRVGAMHIDGRRELCLIKNISAGGMMIRAYCALAKDAPLSVELKCGERVAGTVSWVKGDTVGIAFDEPIDVLEILTNNDKGPRPRMPRVEIDCPITLYDEGQRIEVRGVDISQGGIKVETDCPLIRDADIAVTLPGLAPEAGVVKWIDGEFAGITFNRLIPLSKLIGWLKDLRDGVRAA